jgi:hypothetical protein
MPPVRSRLLNLLMALSLLLCVAVCMLWVRSYWQADCLFFWNTRGEWSAETSAGYLSVETSNIHGGDAGVWRLVTPSASVAFYRRVMRSRAVHSFAGFVYAVDVRPSSAVGLMAELESRGIRTPPGRLTRRFWYIPMWAAFTLAGAPAFLLLWPRLVVRHRRLRGLCPRCGYDLIPSQRPVIAILRDEPLPRRQPTPRP